MKEIIEVEGKVVKERTLEVIAAEIRTIDAQMCQTVLQGAIEIGRRLQEAKEQTGHGNWRNWCKENLNYSEDWAENMMRIAEEYGTNGSAHFAAISNTDTCRNLSISKALKLLKVQEEDIEDFVKENNPGDLTVKELEEKIRALQEEKEGIGDDLVAVQDDYTRTAEEVKAAREALEKAQKEKEEAEKKAEKLKEKLDKEKAAQGIMKEQAKEEAKKEAREAIREELQKEMEEAEQAKTRAEQVAKEAGEREADAIAKLDRASNPDLAVFAVKRQILFETFDGMLDVISREPDLEQKEKYKRAALDVIDKLREDLE